MLLADELILFSNIFLLKLPIKCILYVLSQLLELVVAFVLTQLTVSYVRLFLGVVELAAESIEVAVVVRRCVLAVGADVEVSTFVVVIYYVAVLLVV